MDYFCDGHGTAGFGVLSNKQTARGLRDAILSYVRKNRRLTTSASRTCLHLRHFPGIWERSGRVHALGSVDHSIASTVHGIACIFRSVWCAANCRADVAYRGLLERTGQKGQAWEWRRQHRKLFPLPMVHRYSICFTQPTKKAAPRSGLAVMRQINGNRPLSDPGKAFASSSDGRDLELEYLLTCFLVRWERGPENAQYTITTS